MKAKLCYADLPGPTKDTRRRVVLEPQGNESLVQARAEIERAKSARTAAIRQFFLGRPRR
jgi:hypothetical protein